MLMTWKRNWGYLIEEIEKEDFMWKLFEIRTVNKETDNYWDE